MPGGRFAHQAIFWGHLVFLRLIRASGHGLKQVCVRQEGNACNGADMGWSGSRAGPIVGLPLGKVGFGAVALLWIPNALPLQYFQKVIPHQFDSCPDKLILRAFQVKYNPKKMKR